MIAAVEQKYVDPYANVQSRADIGRALLEQVGLSKPRPDQIDRAAS